MGGLSCGVILAKQGYEVTVLEQGVQLGGCLQCFTRNGARFETGMHFLGSADPGQILYRLFDYLEILPDISLNRLDTEGYNVISLSGERYRIANGREAFIETLLQKFPTQADSLARYFDKVKEVVGVCTLDQMQSAQASAILTQYQLTSMGEVIASMVEDPQLRAVLCGDIPLYAGVPDRTPFALHAQLMDFYNCSTFRLRGGSDVLVRSMVNTIERYGGSVQNRSKVTRVICNAQQRVTGVEVNSSRMVHADLVVSTIHPQVLLPLIDPGMLRPAYCQRIAAIPNTPSVFSLYIKFSHEALPYMNSNFFGNSTPVPWGCETYDDESWPKNYMYMHMCPAKQTQWAESGVMLAYMYESDCKPWIETRLGHRGAEYEAWKVQKAERMLDVLENDFPGIRSKIDSYYTASPLTYRDYNNTPGGAMYGIQKDVTAGPANHISYRTRLPNLLLAGQNINSHGLLGVLVGSLTACGGLLNKSII